MAKKVAQTILQYVIDKGSVSAAVAANNQIIGGTKDLVTAGQMLQRTFDAEAQSAKQLSTAQQVLAQTLKQDAADKAATDMQVLGMETSVTATKVGILAQQYRDVKAAQDAIRLNSVISSEPSNAALGLGRSSGGIGKGITKAGRDLFNLPDVGGSTTASRLLILAGAAVDRLGINATQLAIGAGIAAPALLGLVVAADVVGDAIKENTARHKRYAEALFTVSEAIEKGTTQGIEAQIAALEEENRIKQRGIDLTLQQAGASEQQLASLSRTEFADFSSGGMVANLLAGLSGISGSAEVVKQANDEIDKNTFLIAALREELEATSPAARAAAEAERELTDARNEYIEQITGDFEDEAKLRLELAELRRTGTSEQLAERQAAIRDEQAILQNFLIPSIESLGLTSEAAQIQLAAYNARLDFLAHSNDLLVQSVKPVIELREREAKAAEALTDQTDKYFEALKQEEEIRDEMADLREKEADAWAEARRDAAMLLFETDQKIADAQADAAEKRLDLEEDVAEKRQDIAEDAAEKLFKLQRDAGRDLFDATAERDALAHSKRSRQHADDLYDQQQADEKAQEKLNEQLVKQEETVDKSLTKQLRTIDQQYWRQQETIDAAYNKTLQQVRRAYQEQEVALQNTLFNEQQIALYGSGSQRVIHTQMWTDLAGIAAIGMRNVVSAFGGAIGGVFGGGGSQFPTLSSTYPGGPSQTQVFNQQWDRRYVQAINASSGVRGPI